VNDRLYRVNHQIRMSPVTLINQEGRNMGAIPLQKAMDIALESGLDLVEIAPNSRPPVCRILDFGKFKYEQAIKEKQQKKKQSKTSQLKEVHLSPSIQNHDIETKSKSVRKFIESGHKVVVKLEFRRRELAHRDLGDKVMADFIAGLSDVCEVSSKPKHEGKSLCCTLSPLDADKGS
jgi:translation initiation factor IF-3